MPHARPEGLQRFVDAQRDAWPTARAELQRGRKTSHWMWFVFPQLAGLGRSPMAVRYALDGLGEAREYLAHPVLGPRLLEAAGIVADSSAASIEALLGGIDAMKLRSSMTLFELAAPGEPVLARVLERWFDGRRDELTLDLLGR